MFFMLVGFAYWWLWKRKVEGILKTIDLPSVPSLEELSETFNAFAEGETLDKERFKLACSMLHVYPTPLQVEEAIYTAFKCRNSSRTPDTRLERGEFVIILLELVRARQEDRVSTAVMKLTTKRQDEHQGSGQDVFLGGVCNPTTWRRDIAIPFLVEKGLSYYNPQVSEWKPSLLKLEEDAKKNARALLFVIDNQTRGIASMVEVSYLIGCNMPVILCMLEYDASKTVSINGEALGDDERLEVSMSRMLLAEMALRAGYPIFRSVEAALNAVCKLVSEGMRVQDISHGAEVAIASCPKVPIGQMLQRLASEFNIWDGDKNGFVTPIEALKLHQSLFRSPPVNRPTNNLSFNDFCILAAQHIFRLTVSYNDSVFRRLHTASEAPNDWCSPTWHDDGHRIVAGRRNQTLVDICVNGSKATKWREKEAYPLLERGGMTWSSPDWSGPRTLRSLLSVDSRVSLFVIGDSSLDAVAMVQAAHLIGKETPIVLCIQKVGSGSIVSGCKLSDHAIADYNRGRTYLEGVSNNKRVPVFALPREAIHQAILRARESIPSKSPASKRL